MNYALKFGLSVYKRQFPSIISTTDVFKSVESAIWAVEGTKDYVAFGAGIGVDVANSILFFSFRQGTDHNVTADGDLMITTSTDGNTWSVPSIALAAGGAQRTDPACFCTSNGIWFIFYTFEPAPLVREKRYIYSTNQGTSWSSELKVTGDYASPGQISGPGRPIEVDGFIYVPNYARPIAAGSREGVLYKKAITDDFSITESFTKEPLLYNIENFNGEEPTILHLSDGTYLGLVRSDPDVGSYMFWSPDAQKWARVSSKFNTRAVNSLIETPNKTILGISRFNTGSGRPVYFFSKDGFKTVTVENLDTYDQAFIYGDLAFVPWLNKIIAIYAVTFPNEVTPGISGPTLIKKKELSEGVDPAIIAYDNKFQMLKDWNQGVRNNQPSTDLCELINQLIIHLTSDGIWSQLSVLWVGYYNDSNLENLSFLNIKQPNLYKLVKNSSPSYSVDGWDFDGVDDALLSTWIPSTHGGSIYQQNSASLFCWTEENVASLTQYDVGCSNGNATTVSRGPVINSRSNTDGILFAINDNTLEGPSGITDGRGFIMAQRQGSAAKRLWKNGVQIYSSSTASDTRAARALAVGAINFNNGLGRFSSRKVSMAGAGASLAGLELTLYNRLNQFRSDVQLI